MIVINEKRRFSNDVKMLSVIKRKPTPEELKDLQSYYLDTECSSTDKKAIECTFKTVKMNVTEGDSGVGYNEVRLYRIVRGREIDVKLEKVKYPGGNVRDKIRK